jgi:two-component system chemotaxis sensor kinase CheA
MDRDQMARRLLVTFASELDEQVRIMNADLLALETAPADVERLRSLFRVVHSLKGAARAARVDSVEEVCHALEAALAEVRSGRRTLGHEQFGVLFRAADALTAVGNRLKAGAEAGEAVPAELRKALQTLEAGATTGRRPPPAAEAAASVPPPVIERSDGHVRVEADKLDGLLAAAGQIPMLEERLAQHPVELQSLHEYAVTWALTWKRTSRQLRLALDHSPALVRSLELVSAHAEHLIQESRRLAALALQDTRSLARITDDVADRARRLRLRPFAEACQVLPRTVRDLATSLGKEARLVIRGGEVEADRAVLDGLRDALLHLVRNAVDHGIETAAERQAAGKPAMGEIMVEAALSGDRIVVSVADDGAGMRADALCERMRAAGAPVPGTDRELGDALFRGGFSTRSAPTVVSGRGVGLDAVRAAVGRIRGRVAVAWEAGRGTRFTIEAPPSLATIRVVLVGLGPQTLAIPTSAVDRLCRVNPASLHNAEGRDVLTTPEGPVPLASLAKVLGPPFQERPTVGMLPMVVVRSGERRLALVVDELRAEQEVVVRPVGRKDRPSPNLSGAALLGTGEVALVLDPAAVVDAGLGLGGRLGVSSEAAEGTPTRRRLLVVDDSITTRALEQSVLQAAGYEVDTAVDGADAWRQLQERGADLVVADVDMPRMDGFGLCAAIRASTRFRRLPLVLVTALESTEHRARGLEVGADAYLGKSSFDQQQLLDVVRQLLGT